MNNKQSDMAIHKFRMEMATKQQKLLSENSAPRDMLEIFKVDETWKAGGWVSSVIKQKKQAENVRKQKLKEMRA